MNWADLGKQVIGLGAPLLGRALGGPLGGVAGDVLAKALGMAEASPSGVKEALPSADPLHLAQAEARWLALLREEAVTERDAIVATHQTIRREITASDLVQRWWRPFYAFELTIECACLWAVVLHEFWTGDLQTINALVNATALLVTYWGFRFSVLGVYIGGRTREKVCAATGRDSPGVVEQLIDAVSRKKK